MAISEEVASAMRLARERSGMDHAQFARELNRVVGVGRPGYDLSGSDVAGMEADGLALAVHLIAAARIAEQPVSAILGEDQLTQTTIGDLERRVARLEALYDV